MSLKGNSSLTCSNGHHVTIMIQGIIRDIDRATITKQESTYLYVAIGKGSHRVSFYQAIHIVFIYTTNTNNNYYLA